MGALLMAGCAVPYSPAPLATNFPSSQQAKLQAAAHWHAITGHIEKELAPALQKSPNIPLYIEIPQATAFSQAVAGQLTTSLVNDGYVVAKSPRAALKVEIDTQVVEFSAHRPQYKFAGERSALVGGLWVLTEIEHTPQWMATVGIVGEDAYSWFRSEFASGATPKTEIIVTISVSDERRYYARYTSVYYVTDSERYLYEVAPPPKENQQIVKTFTVKGS
ncbi:putative uncharacterized protein [Janthinobacterium agaricidamnosum NBRC 102515 = DSM 9628]|uniref:Uncharacterized protein n=1 Tax=Janthinobacterium agaricidamnosum NBRC 102515 = DSM 9628 TaxID=1349767 RepID=W0V802_9BURK|nr:putative uncharacterized protein [Janthinobacterium agaricidamnosum NBRC 102515 = DSM 9628]